MPSEDLHGVSGYMKEIASMLREAGISQMSFLCCFRSSDLKPLLFGLLKYNVFNGFVVYGYTVWYMI